MGEHDGAGRRRFGGVERLVQLGKQLTRERVAIVLRVEGDRGNCMVDLDMHDR